MIDVADRLTMADWVHGLAPWQVISHLTFRWEASLESGRRCYEKFMRRHLARVSYFYALEENPCRDGFHVHALWADAGSVFRREAWAAWFKAYGRARIEPVRSKGDVSDYCSKYVTKEGAWWNVKLQWHRLQAQHGASFALERGPAPLPVAPLAVSSSFVQDAETVCGSVSLSWARRPLQSL